MRAQDFPSPAPINAEVGFNISGIPGPPTGPIFLMTATSPACNRPDSMPSIKCCSPSKTRAVPLKNSPSLPEIFATEPPWARLPYKICKCPVILIGFLSGRIIS